MIKVDIQSILDEKGITRYELAKRVGITYPTIDSIYKGKSTSIKFEILEKICLELECTPNDILSTDDPTLQQIYLHYDKSNN